MASTSDLDKIERCTMAIDTQSDGISDRVSRLEGAYEHLATKADLAEAKAEIMKWTAGLALVIIGAVGAMEVLFRLFGD